MTMFVSVCGRYRHVQLHFEWTLNSKIMVQIPKPRAKNNPHDKQTELTIIL